MAAVGCGASSPRGVGWACQTSGVSPWQADLQPRFVRVWKLKCVELIPVLGRKRQQLMEFIVGDRCKGCPLEALVVEPLAMGQGRLCCAPQMELSGVPAWTCLAVP